MADNKLIIPFSFHLFFRKRHSNVYINTKKVIKLINKIKSKDINFYYIKEALKQNFICLSAHNDTFN
ncbi:hypothetical protein BU015_04275 [Staphylococcus simulans]|nr:hypothetical protein BU015_04275 [Staphylococcus simulans]